MPGLDRRPQRRRDLNHSSNRGPVKQHPTAPHNPHNPRNCRRCAPFRHPSGATARRQLAVIAPPRTPLDNEVGK